MAWQTLLQLANLTSLALIPTTVDRVVVWGLVALVIGLIAWREYTLPDVSPPLAAPGAPDGLNSKLASHSKGPDLLSGAAPSEGGEPGPVGRETD